MTTVIRQMKWVDSHCHSNHSFDGESSIDALCRQAVKLRFHALAVTDHCEIDAYETGGYRETIRKAMAEIKRCGPIYQHKLDLLTGVELGQPMENLENVDDLLSLGTFDFVLASLHNVKGKPDFYFQKYENMDVHALLKQYFQELCDMISWGGFDALAHLTYPLRYIVGEKKIPVDRRKINTQIDETLRLLAEKGLALEINTSGLRQKIGVTMPDLPLLKRFRALGGEYVTVGSDAHRAADLGKGIVESYEIARNAGFQRLVYYKRREPQEILIG